MQDNPYAHPARMSNAHTNHTADPNSWIPPQPSHPARVHSPAGSNMPFQPSHQELLLQQQSPQYPQHQQPPQSFRQHQNGSSASLGSASSMSPQSNTSTPVASYTGRSEERRVGKECRAGL